ncbi:unnamed protein product [Penicillium nalgiovense]|nr:unnamed protein product [Penicillium nalgiovense]
MGIGIVDGGEKEGLLGVWGGGGGGGRGGGGGGGGGGGFSWVKMKMCLIVEMLSTRHQRRSSAKI